MTLQRSERRWPLRFAVLAAATLTAVLLGRLTTQVTGLTLIWPAAGVIVLWWHEVRTRQQAVAAAALLAVVVTVGNLLTGSGADLAATFLIMNLVHAVVGGEVLRRLRGRDRLTLEGLGDLGSAALAAVAAGVASSASAFAGATFIAELAAPVPSAAFVLIRNASSTFLVLAFVAGLRAAGPVSGPRPPTRTAAFRAAAQRVRARPTRIATAHGAAPPRTREAAAMLLVTTVLCALLFGVEGTPPLAFTVLAVSVWSGLRLGVRWTAVHAGVATVLVVGLTLRGHGIFGDLSSGVAVLVAQAFLVVLTATGLSIALLHSRLETATRQERAVAAQLSATIDAALVGHATVGLDEDDHGRFLAVNPALATFLGAPAEQLVGTAWETHVAEADRGYLAEILADLRRGAADVWSGELCHTDLAGQNRWTEVAIARVDTVDPVRASVQLIDVTARKDLEAELTHLALHDPLTGLPNRALLLDRLAVALGDSERAGNHTAVLFFDLENFKSINESLGHTAGDQLIAAIGRRLGPAVRPGDTVARLGGDEFVVCCPRIAAVEEAVAVAERVLSAVEQPVRLKSGPVAVSLCGGVTLSRRGDTAQGLLRQSSTALFAARGRGRRLQISDDDLRARAVRHRGIRIDLDEAVRREEIVCYYQPLVELATGQVVGAEALARWAHPTRGMLEPVDWLGVAEESGAIVPIGGLVLRQACRWAAELSTHQPAGQGPLSVHVNVSGRQFATTGTVDQVLDALEASGLDPVRLVIELTETHLVHTDERLVRDLSELRRHGVRVSADDFGTGFSSLSQLVELPVDEVKVDRSFVARAPSDPRSAAIVHGLLGMADALQLEVVAEGIESAAQVRLLQELGCATGQGFLWSPAVPGDAWPWLVDGGGRLDQHEQPA